MDKSLIDVGKLADPLTKLVEVVSQGIGTLYKPIGTIRQAQADGQAAIILAQAEIGKQELCKRAAARISHIELQRQENIEIIVERAKQALPETVSQEPVNKDWINYFFNSCQDVNDSDLQALWAKILANEVNKPGATSKRTLEFLKILEKHEAELFEVLLAVSLKTDDGWHFIVECDATYKAIKQIEPKFNVIKHLTDIGIIAAETSNYEASKISETKCSFGGENFKFIGPPPPICAPSGLPDIEFLVSLRHFTGVGQSLSRVAKSKPMDGLIDKISKDLEGEAEVKIVPVTSTTTT